MYYPDSSELVTPIASRTAFESRLRDSSGTHLVSGTFRFNVTAFSAGALSELTYDGVLVSRVKSLRTSELQPVIFGRQTEAFDDTRYARNVPPPASEDASLLSVMSMMTGSTDNYIRYDEVSATCGWYYDNNMSVGTDSLAFGGMTY